MGRIIELARALLGLRGSRKNLARTGMDTASELSPRVLGIKHLDIETLTPSDDQEWLQEWARIKELRDE